MVSPVSQVNYQAPALSVLLLSALFNAMLNNSFAARFKLKQLTVNATIVDGMDSLNPVALDSFAKFLEPVLQDQQPQQKLFWHRSVQGTPVV